MFSQLARTMDKDGNCYRAVIVYRNARDNQDYTSFFGPFDEPGKAKAARTRFKNNEYHYQPKRGDYIVEEYVEVTDTWRRV